MSRRYRCEHNVATKNCKICRSIYDEKYRATSLLRYKEFLTSKGCSCCGFSHPSVLEVHHFATEYKRYGRSQGISANMQDLQENKALILCANCHVIFHGVYGGKVKPFPLLTKDETIEVIKNAIGDTL